jgi:hypothetical protein
VSLGGVGAGWTELTTPVLVYAGRRKPKDRAKAARPALTFVGRGQLETKEEQTQCAGRRAAAAWLAGEGGAREGFCGDVPEGYLPAEGYYLRSACRQRGESRRWPGSPEVQLGRGGGRSEGERSGGEAEVLEDGR